MGHNSDRHEEIIAFVCGNMSRDERALFASLMVDDAVLAAEVDAVRRALSPLNAWQAPEPKASLLDDIMQQVDSTTPLEYVASTAPLSADQNAQPARRGWFTLPQFFAVAASIALILSVLFPTLQNQHDRKMQQACLGNLHQIGRSLYEYTSAFNGAMPQVDATAPENWLSQPQRIQLRPLVQLRFISPRALVCPTTGGEDFDDDVARENFDEFAQRSDLRFYAVQHPDAVIPRLRARLPLPLFADQNPLFAGGKYNDVDETANSPAHGGRGQNVLMGNVSAEFLQSPRFQQTDNIWRVEEQISTYTGVERPVSATDSFLIP